MTKSSDLAKALAKELERYSKIVEEDFEQLKKKTSNELKKDIQKTSPFLTGSYEAGWKVKRTKNGFIVHNATEYQLTHLLEHGHAKKGGGRTMSFPHIRPAEEKHVKAFLKDIERMVKE